MDDELLNIHVLDFFAFFNPHLTAVLTSLSAADRAKCHRWSSACMRLRRSVIKLMINDITSTWQRGNHGDGTLNKHYVPERGRKRVQERREEEEDEKDSKIVFLFFFWFVVTS